MVSLSRSKLKPCPLCGKRVKPRGYIAHLRLAHGIAAPSREPPRRPECSRCMVSGALILWSEKRRCVFRCPRCYRYLGPATPDQTLLLPLIPEDNEDLEELRRKWVKKDEAPTRKRRKGGGRPKGSVGRGRRKEVNP